MTTHKKYRSDYLFVKGSFFLGLASIISVNGTFLDFNYYESESESDFRALDGDWRIVGQDIGDSIDKFKIELANVKAEKARY